jgi:hypothetical protein
MLRPTFGVAIISRYVANTWVTIFCYALSAVIFPKSQVLQIHFVVVFCH